MVEVTQADIEIANGSAEIPPEVGARLIVGGGRKVRAVDIARLLELVVRVDMPIRGPRVNRLGIVVHGKVGVAGRTAAET